MRRLLAVPLALLALTVPADARSGPHFISLVLTTDPVPTASGFAMSMEFLTPGPHSSAWLEVAFTKKTGPVTQRHTWDIGLSRRDLRCNRIHTRCTLDTRADLRNPIGQPVGHVMDFGRIRLRFVASSAVTKVPLPTRCGGTRTRETMRVSGSFHFDTHYSLFGKVRTVGSKAEAVRSNSIICTPPPCTGATDLEAWPHPPANESVSLWLHGTSSTDGAYLSLQWGGGPFVSHEIVVENVPWTIAPDLSSATFDASGLPLFSGTLEYHADSSPAQIGAGGCNGPAVATTDNDLSGNLVIRPDGHDPITFGPGSSGRLIRWP